MVRLGRPEEPNLEEHPSLLHQLQDQQAEPVQAELWDRV